MPKPSDTQQAQAKLERYCAWQERCVAEVKAKMEQLEIPISQQSALIEYLEDEGYLNEARYALQFASGKFRFKKWGRIKIRYDLAAKMVPEKLVDQAVNALNLGEYETTLKALLEEKRKTLPNIKDPYQLNHKVSVYAIGKGFEPDLVWQILKATYPIK